MRRRNMNGKTRDLSSIVRIKEGTGNIDSDPLLVDPDGWDFDLSPASPCIDAGDSGAAGLQLADSGTSARVVNDIVDMGANPMKGF